jgi:hypothetical protein
MEGLLSTINVPVSGAAAFLPANLQLARHLTGAIESRSRNLQCETVASTV